MEHDVCYSLVVCDLAHWEEGAFYWKSPFLFVEAE